jgi:hypothetical protein
MWKSRSVRTTVSESRSRRRPNAAAIRPHAASAKNATRSSSRLMERVRYGSVRKKFRLRADMSAVTSAGPRPPTSATTIVKAMKANARLAAATTPRSGISRMPSAIAPSAPVTVQISPWSSPLIVASFVMRPRHLRRGPSRARRARRGSA